MKIDTILISRCHASWFSFEVSSLDVEVIIHLISDNDWINQLTLLQIYGDGRAQTDRGGVGRPGLVL